MSFREKTRDFLQRVERDFIHARYRDDARKTARAREALYLMPLVSLGMLYFSIGHMFTDSTPIGPVVLALCSAICMSLLYLMRAGYAIDFLVNVMLSIFVFLAFWYMMGVGGLVSPQGVWLAIVPGVAYYILGARSFWIWFWVVVCAISVTSFVSIYGHSIKSSYFPSVRPEAIAYDYLMVTIGVFFIYSFMTFFLQRERDRAEEEIFRAKQEAEKALAKLQQAQTQLVEQEKMAALGALVAGVAHEVNTPIGNALTATSLLMERSQFIEKLFQDGKVRRSDFEAFLKRVAETSRIALSNINRAASLVQSFKNIAVDQSHDEIRKFNLCEYLEDVALSLKPGLQRGGHAFSVECPRDIELRSYPGAFSQIVTNLVTNSIVHAYPKGVSGKLGLVVTRPQEKSLLLTYSDDGVGMSKEVQAHVFDPFFTTRRTEGGTGLGMNIVFNLVVHKLKGNIKVESEPGKGVVFTVFLPEKDFVPAPSNPQDKGVY